MKPPELPLAITPEAAYTKVEQLVQKFKALSAARRRDFNEAATRQAFILPLFAALGWNVTDTAEVSPEEKTSRGWVDFSFRLSGIPRFFLETKKIAADLADPRWVRQAIDYAWTKSVTWALLSDFEGLRVFNAEWKEDNPLRSQFIEFSVDTYLTDFPRLWWLSRPETAAGTLDREAEKVGKKVRKEPVSYHLFDDLKEWRHELFKALRAYNKRYSLAQIDEAVLRILNRLIFIRTAEDREVEERCLLPLLRDLEEHHRMGHLPAELTKLFREFDATYDSDLFAAHFSEDLDCESEPFKVLIEGLYEKRGGYVRYNFNAIDADVLGTVYEQYLGYVIAEPGRGEPGARPVDKVVHGARPEVVEKRAKRKAQGIYYTPTFVVKYIVQQTLGRYLEEQGYQPSRPLRLLDMACGSGSFLIEAFDVLDRYLARQRGQVRGEREDVIDYARRMEILSQNIYGVDKDEQAVAVARLNLLLKALHTRDKLPMLENIRCGDSLISGPPEELQAAFGPDWQEKKPFNWKREFPEVFTPTPTLPLAGGGQSEGGFDVIVGNPPYVQMSMDATLRETFGRYLVNRFGSSMGRLNTFGFFIHLGIDLLRPGGSLGFIVPNTILTMPYYRELRKYMLDRCAVEIIGTLEEGPFTEAVVENVILVLRREDDPQVRRDNLVWVKNVPTTLQSDTPGITICQSEYEQAHGFVFNVRFDGGAKSLQTKALAHADPLGTLVNINQAIALKGDRSASLFNRSRGNDYKPVLDGRDIGRYVIRWPGTYLKYDLERIHSCKREDIFLAEEKLFFRRVGEGIVATFDDNQFYALNTLVVVTPKTPNLSLRFILAIMNSCLMNYYFAAFLKSTKKVFSEIQARQMSQLPIRRINVDDPADRQRHDAIVTLVTEMLQLQKDYAQAEREKEDRRHPLRRRIGEVDAAIDRLVYELYGLTEEEIAVVEGTATKPQP
jgi:type I restriction-modification system DNA methylase subunit